MQTIIIASAAFFAVIWLGIVSCAPQQIKLTDVQTLIFNRDAFTLARRSDSLPQLSCTGGPCEQYGPNTVLCKNVGSNGVDVNWKCEAEHTGPVRFKQLAVTCEGYDYPHDPYILYGSCALEYSLELLPSAAGVVEDQLTIVAFIFILLLCLITFGVLCHYCNLLCSSDDSTKDYHSFSRSHRVAHEEAIASAAEYPNPPAYVPQFAASAPPYQQESPKTRATPPAAQPSVVVINNHHTVAPLPLVVSIPVPVPFHTVTKRTVKSSKESTVATNASDSRSNLTGYAVTKRR